MDGPRAFRLWGVFGCPIQVQPYIGPYSNGAISSRLAGCHIAHQGLLAIILVVIEISYTERWLNQI